MRWETAPRQPSFGPKRLTAMPDTTDPARRPAPDRANGLTYRDAGVDVDAGNALVERIKPLVAATARPGAIGTIGGFGGLFDLKAAGYDDPVLVAGTDGVGTKLRLATDLGRHTGVGIDLVAMCVNDLVVQGAEPLFFLDYFATGALDPETAADVVAGIATGCKRAGCALIGGETAEMPGHYRDGDYDLAGFCVGAVNRDAILPRSDMDAGDALIAVAASGPHSNGYSLIRRIIDAAGWDLTCPAPAPDGLTFGDDQAPETLADALLMPTRIYVTPLLSLLKSGAAIKGLAHITGGGLTDNIPRVLPAHCTASIDLNSWRTPAIFARLAEGGGVADAEMLRTFNCGVGMVLVVARDDTDGVLEHLTAAGERAWVVGSLVPRDGAESTAGSIAYSGHLFADAVAG